MAHVVTKPNAPLVSQSGALTVHHVVAAQDNLVWILVCNATGQAAAIDGPNAEPVLAYCDAHGIALGAIFNTHTHPDHIGINAALARAGKLDTMRVVGPRRRAADVPGITERVDEGDTVTLGQARGRVLLTEGHIDGHISYVFDDLLFCGDTMFGAGCGYLFDGPPSKMFQSLSRLAELPAETKVFCAHEYTQDNLRFAWSIDPANPDLVTRIRDAWAVRARGECTIPSTIGLERRTNPFLRSTDPAVVARVREQMPDRDLSTPAAVFAATRALKDRKDYRALPDSALPLCVTAGTGAP
jgi:hydroxyacylglutathione hydrolase